MPAENKQVHWTRVDTLPDYVCFDRSSHIAKGVYTPAPKRRAEAARDRGSCPR